MEKELEGVNKRYDALERRLTDSLEDLRIMRIWADKVESVKNMADWLIKIDAQLLESKPSSKELQPLKQELEGYQVWC